MRQLKHHERKLLKKVDFLRWKNEHNLRELQVRGLLRTRCMRSLPAWLARRGAARPHERLGELHAPMAARLAAASLIVAPNRAQKRARCGRFRFALRACLPSTLAPRTRSPAPARRRPPPPADTQQVMRRYHIQERDDYKKYNKIVGMITKLVSQLRRLDADDAERIALTDRLLTK